jgi:hypothetical protein
LYCAVEGAVCPPAYAPPEDIFTTVKSGLLHRASGEAKDAVKTAAADEARDKRNDSDQIKRAVVGLWVEEKGCDKRETDDDAQNAIEFSDVFLKHYSLL